MANEFIARKGLIALADSQITGSLNLSGTLSIPGFTDVSSSLAAAVAGGDNLGNHIATQDLNMGGNNITSVGNVDGVDVSALNTSVSTNTTNIATLTAATSSYSTATGVEDNADVTDTANVTAAGALMDSEVTSLSLIKGLTAAQISGAAAITTYNNASNNRVITSVNSTTVNSEANLTFDGSSLNVAGNYNIDSYNLASNTSGPDAIIISNDDNRQDIHFGKNTLVDKRVKIFGQLTASAEISSSEKITAKRVGVDDYIVHNGNASNRIAFGTDTITIQSGLFSTTGTRFSFPITASGNISASGNVYAAEFHGDGSNLTNLPSQTDENFTTADHSKLDGIEANADVTDATNVQAAGALMDSEVTNLAQVKAFDSSDYATAAQGTKADTAVQPADTASLATIVELNTSSSALQSNIDSNKSAANRITYLYTASAGSPESVAENYIHYVDSTVDFILINTSSYNNVDLDGSSTTAYSNFFYTDAGSLLTVRNVDNGAFRTFKVTNVVTNYQNNGDTVRFQVDSLLLDMSSGSLSDGDEVEFIWDKSAGVGGAYGATAGSGLAKTLAGIYQGGYNYLDMFFGTAADTEFDGAPDNLSGVEPSASFGLSRYFLPAISQSESLTLGGLTVNGNITVTGNVDGTDVAQLKSDFDTLEGKTLVSSSDQILPIATSSITDFPTEVSRSAAAAGFGSGGGGGGTVDTSGTPANDQLAVFTDSDTIEGSNKLKFASSILDVASTNSDSSTLRLFGGVVGSAAPYITHYGAHTTLRFGDGTSGHIFDMQNNKLAFDNDSTNTYIQANTDVPEDLEIHADQDIILAADNAVVIGAVTDVEDRISSYRTQIVSNGFYGQNSLRYMSFNTTGETTGFNYLSLMPAPANGRLISISAWPQSSGGSTVIGLHINSNATAATTDTQTLTAGTPVTFTFSSNNTFSQNDEISFSVNPTNTPNGLFFSIILEYDY